MSLIPLMIACSPDYNLSSYDLDGGEELVEYVAGDDDNNPEPETDDGTSNDDEECIPTGEEYCDGIDNDCDGFTDEGDAIDATTWYLDEDGDGHGSTVSIIACAPPAGYVESNDDCDDTNKRTYPGADEWCDFLDNDCDGLNEIQQQPEYSWMIYHDDDDGDGYGAAPEEGGGFGCSIYGDIPEGHARSNDDCNDQDASINPGAVDVENGIDDDCDGVID